MCRWDGDVVFKSQARAAEDKRKKEFVNVRLLQSGMQMMDWLIITIRISYVQTSTSDSWPVLCVLLTLTLVSWYELG